MKKTITILFSLFIASSCQAPKTQANWEPVVAPAPQCEQAEPIPAPQWEQAEPIPTPQWEQAEPKPEPQWEVNNNKEHEIEYVGKSGPYTTAPFNACDGKNAPRCKPGRTIVCPYGNGCKTCFCQ